MQCSRKITLSECKFSYGFRSSIERQSIGSAVMLPVPFYGKHLVAGWRKAGRAR